MEKIHCEACGVKFDWDSSMYRMCDECLAAWDSQKITYGKPEPEPVIILIIFIED